MCLIELLQRTVGEILQSVLQYVNENCRMTFVFPLVKKPSLGYWKRPYAEWEEYSLVTVQHHMTIIMSLALSIDQGLV